MEDFDVYLKLYGEIVQVEGRDYALIRKLSAFSENPLFPEMLCVNVRPVKMVPLEILGEGEECKGECEMPRRYKMWETAEPFLQELLDPTDTGGDTPRLW